MPGTARSHGTNRKEFRFDGPGVRSCRCRRVAIVQREIELVDPVDLCSADGRR